MSLELSSYEKITIQLKDHYESTIDAIFKDKTSEIGLKERSMLLLPSFSRFEEWLFGSFSRERTWNFKDKLFCATLMEKKSVN